MKNYVLVVDEDQLILYSLAKSFKNDGYDVATAATAKEAIEKLSYCPFDLCLMDIHLSDLDGFALMDIIREMCPKTRVVVMTTSYIDSVESDENNKKVFAYGACNIIYKPFTLYEISEVVQQVLTEGDNSLKGPFFNKECDKKSRKNPRNPCNENICFKTGIIDQGSYTRRLLQARIVDVSDKGIGLVTQYPLKELQVVSFDEKMENRTGVVVWSKMLDDKNCQAGIRFA